MIRRQFTSHLRDSARYCASSTAKPIVKRSTAFLTALFIGISQLTGTRGLVAADTIELPDASVYTGELRGPLLHGDGELRWPDGRHYSGQFRSGLIHGQGILVYRNGDRYAGQFDNGLRHGRGRFATTDGESYEGEFRNDVFSGRGRHNDEHGLIYSGNFQDWRYHGSGHFYWRNGDEYVGSFVDGQFHGLGEVRYKDNRGGKQRLTGSWERGRFVEPPGHSTKTPKFNAERLLFRQRQLLDQALENVGFSKPEQMDLFFLSFAGDGNQDVFMKEAVYAETRVADKFNTDGFSMNLINNPALVETQPMATITNLEYVLNAFAARMQEEDVLFLLLTSHGSDDHHLIVDLANLPLADLPAGQLSELLHKSGIQWKVIVVSACYSGGFIKPLADERSLVITAAGAENLSFGCTDEAELTYFGRAFFAHGLRGSDSLFDAFLRARQKVRTMEKAAGYSPSEPQISYTQAILDKLSNWNR